MAKQRDKVKMTDEEIAKFFSEVKSLNVATLDKSGAPHLTTLWYSTLGNDVLFETYGTSQKVVNLRRDPRIAAICEAGTDYNELRGVSITGHAEIVDQEPRLTQLMSHILRKNAAHLTGDAFDAHVAQMVRKRVVVIIHPDKVMSWDHRKIAAAAA